MPSSEDDVDGDDDDDDDDGSPRPPGGGVRAPPVCGGGVGAFPESEVGGGVTRRTSFPLTPNTMMSSPSPLPLLPLTLVLVVQLSGIMKEERGASGPSSSNSSDPVEEVMES